VAEITIYLGGSDSGVLQKKIAVLINIAILAWKKYCNQYCYCYCNIFGQYC